MAKLGIVKKIIEKFKAEYSSNGGVIHGRLVCPKGILSRPKEEKALGLRIENSGNQRLIMPLQKDEELRDGDVKITNDKSYMLLDFKDETIIFKSKKVVFKDCEIIIDGGSMTHDDKPIDKTHKHSYEQRVETNVTIAPSQTPTSVTSLGTSAQDTETPS